MSVRQVNYGSWLFRVFAWDGLMPACVFLVPTVVKSMIPDNRGVFEIAALVTPAIMFVLRLIVGRRHIAANNCSATVQFIQLCVFYFGILVLGFIEGVLILSHLMPRGAFKSVDYVVFAILISIYLTAMSIAMYPGRVDSLEESSML